MKRAKTKTKSRLPIENEKSAGAIVFHRDDEIKYLLLFSNFWGFPKGHVEKGESERAAALREIREETGLEADLRDDFRAVDEYWYQRKGARVKKRAVFFLAEARNREAKISWEHTDAAWLAFDEAMARLQFPRLREILEKANEFLKNQK